MLLECQDMVWGVLRLCEVRSLGETAELPGEAETVGAFGKLTHVCRKNIRQWPKRRW